MGCPEQLATKQDFTDQDGRLLSQLATKEQAEEILYKLGRVETGTDTTIPGAIANIFESIISLVRDPIVAAIEGTTDVINNGIDFLENTIISAIQGVENVFTTGISAFENVLVTGLETVQAGIAGVTQIAVTGFETLQTGISAVENVAIEGFSAIQTVSLAIRDVVVEALDILRILPDTLAEVVLRLNQLVIDGVSSLLSTIFEPIASYFEALDSVIRDLFNLDQEQYSSLEALIQQLIEAVGAIDVSSEIWSAPVNCGNYYSTTAIGALTSIYCGRIGGATGGTSGGSIDAGGSGGTTINPEDLSDRELLEKIANTVGINEFPGTVPKSLLNSGDNPETSGTTEIPNLPQFILWVVKQMDSLIGEFPIEMTIKDADLLAEGDQTVTISLPTIADTLAEIYGQTSSSLIVQSAHTNFLTRLASEAVSTKTAGLITQDLTQSIIDFLGFKNKKIKREGKSAFKLVQANAENVKSLSQILQEGSFKYVGFEFDDSAILLEYLPKFMFVASLIKASLYRTDESDLSTIEDLAAEQLDDANNGWNQFVNEINNPDSFFNLDEPDRPYIRDLNDEA